MRVGGSPSLNLTQRHQGLVAQADEVLFFVDGLVGVGEGELAFLAELDQPPDDAAGRDFVEVFFLRGAVIGNCRHRRLDRGDGLRWF